MKTLLRLFVALVCFSGCDAPPEDTGSPAETETAELAEGSAEAPADEAEAEPAEVPAVVPEEPEVSGTEAGSLTLVTATLPTINQTMLLPAGFTRTRETEQGAGYSFDLGDYRTLMVSLEPLGASSASEARSLGPVVAGGLTVSEVVEGEDGRFLVLFETREHDNMQAVALFTATHYVKCMAPEPYLAELRQMCESVAPAE